jgi:DNA ligase-1
MPLPYGTDMELFSYGLSFYEIESIVMSEEHLDSHKIGFYLLDIFSPNPYYVRLKEIEAIKSQNILIGANTPRTQFCQDADELFKFFRSVEDEEGEGICFRLHDSPYKQGKSTLNEQYLVKLSRYVRAEAKIIGFEEQQLNGNKKTVSALGLTKRSSRQSGIIGKGTLGSFIVECDLDCSICNGQKRIWTTFSECICQECKGSGKMIFNIGTGVGLTELIRQEIWNNQNKYLGKIITYKCKVHGKKIKPRHPVWCGFRNEIDL